MREDLLSAAEMGVDGVVAGMLNDEGDVDAGHLSELMFLCRTLVRLLAQLPVGTVSSTTIS